MDGLLLGLDIGSSRLKAVLVDATGKAAALASVPTPFAVTARGVEMDVAALEAALGEVLAALPPDGLGAIAAVGIGGLAESGAPLIGDKAAGPVIAWHDGRGEEVAARLTHVFGDELALRTGQRPRSVSSVAKLGWLVENGLGALDGWLGVPELCLWLLTGERASDWSLTARTGAFDLGWRDWIPEVFEVAGIPEGVFPEPRPAGAILGRVGRTGSSRFGVRVGTPVTLAGHDHLAAAESLHGRDATRPHTAYNSVGTAECVLGFSVPQPDVATALSLKLAVSLRPSGNGFAVFAGAARSGIVLSDLAELLGRPHAELDDFAPDFDAGREWHAELRALAERTSDATDRLGLLLGRPQRVVAFGGGSHSAPWMRAKAELLAPLPLLRADVGEAAARGAALAAGAATGWWSTPADGPAVELVPVLT